MVVFISLSFLIGHQLGYFPKLHADVEGSTESGSVYGQKLTFLIATSMVGLVLWARLVLQV